jgi:cell division inhibitor SepF
MGAFHNAMIALGLANDVDEDYFEEQSAPREEPQAPVARRPEHTPDKPEREAQVTPIRQRQSVVRTTTPRPSASPSVTACR